MGTRLKGKNQIAVFRRVAEKLVSKIIVHKNVAGVIFLGGLIRNFVDRFSDLDIIVLLNRPDQRSVMQIHGLVMEEKRASTVDVDLEIHLLRDFKKRKWDETDRWDFSKCKIAFDPREEIRKMFEAKLMVPRDFWIRRIAVCGEYVKWYCCPPKHSVGTIAEAWIERGDLTAAHYSLNYAVDLLLKAVFALNKEFLPPPKWRVFCSYDLKWLPKNYKELLGEMMNVRDISARDFNRRLKAIRKMWGEILPKIQDETGLTPDQTSKYYVKKVLRQDFAPSSESMTGAR